MALSIAHESGFAHVDAPPCQGERAAGGTAQAWLKKPPLSSARARSSADSSTLRGVSRNTLSATRCMLPSSAYVRPLAKSISRFESSCRRFAG